MIISKNIAPKKWAFWGDGKGGEGGEDWSGGP